MRAKTSIKRVPVGYLEGMIDMVVDPGMPLLLGALERLDHIGAAVQTLRAHGFQFDRHGFIVTMRDGAFW